ncbi:MAG: CRISPR-associated endonuclease Cas2 [Candidatus Thorarchaeota archaeon]
MYVIVVYDIEVERIDKVRAMLKRYLFWVQNSVFEGELSEPSFQSMISELKALINKQYDSVIIYKLNSPKSVKRSIIGVDKGLTDFII